MPKAPRLHWGWVLALQLLTRGLFSMAWLIVQANWVRRVNGKSRAFVLSIVNVCLFPAFFVLIVIETLLKGSNKVIGAITVVFMVVFVVMAFWTTFNCGTSWSPSRLRSH